MAWKVESMTEQGSMSDQGGMAGGVAEPSGRYDSMAEEDGMTSGMAEQGGMAEDDSMSDLSELAVGPIDYLAIELPAARMKGEGLAALVDLVDQGIIKLLDARAVTREDDGTFTAIALTDLDNDGTLDLAIFEGIESGLLDDDDLQQAAELIEPGKVVALLLYENTWARPFVAAMRRAGAEFIAGGRIRADEVEALLDALEAEEAQAQAT